MATRTPITGPVALPMAGQRRERADAAANRERILSAARAVLAEHGADGLTMQAVASAAGVGKGTVFHRFGDRDGLTAALVDEHMRAFQDRFLHGSPPLGPGAPAAERLEAFVAELVGWQTEHLDVALAAERLTSTELPPAYAALVMHMAALIGELRPDVDGHLVGGLLLNAMAPPVLHRMRTGGGVDVPALQRAAVALVRGLTGPSPAGG